MNWRAVSREEQWKAEAEKWKGLALYLADCHAATAEHEGRLKSTPNCRKVRYRGICRTAVAWIENRDHLKVPSVETVLERLKSAAKEE